MNPVKDILKWVFPNAESIRVSAELVYRLMAASAEVLCRHSFGQRYVMPLIGSWLLALLYGMIINIGLPQPPRLFGTYLFIHLVLVCIHLTGMFRSRQLPIPSRWPGQSWQFWEHFRLSSGVVRTVLEPALLVFIGFIISFGDPALAVWLFGAGVCLFLKELIFHWKHRSRLLDALDARAEGEFLNAGIRRRTTAQSPDEQTAIPVVAAIPPAPVRTPDGQLYQNLDPALQQLISATRPRQPGVTRRPPNRQTPPHNQTTRPAESRVRIVRTRQPPPR